MVSSHSSAPSAPAPAMPSTLAALDTVLLSVFQPETAASPNDALARLAELARREAGASTVELFLLEADGRMLRSITSAEPFDLAGTIYRDLLTRREPTVVSLDPDAHRSDASLPGIPQVSRALFAIPVPTTPGIETPPLGLLALAFDQAPSSPEPLAASTVPIANLAALLLAYQGARYEVAQERCQKASYLSLVTHELKTPLTTVIGYSQLALRELDSGGDEIRSLLDRVRIEARRLAAMIEEVSEASHWETNRVELARRPCEVHELIQRAAAEAERATGRGDLILEALGAFPAGYWDPDRVTRSLATLFIFALRAPRSEVGDLAPRVRARLDPAEGALTSAGDEPASRLLIEVEVAGVEASAADLERLFQPFSQARLARELRIGGLAFYLARQVLQGHGGELHAQSEPSGGVRFVLQLPLSTAQSSPARLTAE